MTTGLPVVGDDLAAPSRRPPRRSSASRRHPAVDLRARVGVLVEPGRRACASRARRSAPRRACALSASAGHVDRDLGGHDAADVALEVERVDGHEPGRRRAHLEHAAVAAVADAVLGAAQQRERAPGAGEPQRRLVAADDAPARRPQRHDARPAGHGACRSPTASAHAIRRRSRRPGPSPSRRSAGARAPGSARRAWRLGPRVVVARRCRGTCAPCCAKPSAPYWLIPTPWPNPAPRTVSRRRGLRGDGGQGEQERCEDERTEAHAEVVTLPRTPSCGLVASGYRRHVHFQGRHRRLTA